MITQSKLELNIMLSQCLFCVILFRYPPILQTKGLRKYTDKSKIAGDFEKIMLQPVLVSLAASLYSPTHKLQLRMHLLCWHNFGNSRPMIL